ncbi:hypothetical protein [Singulisphaera sp. PoT]|uniref:hypothetical protein n=1 Tax=Singulisphaera sp. PoT TaxID=3411797 RepID=UPI003BF5E355
MSSTSTTVPAPSWPTLIFTGLSLSIGWGIRGNFGHETGAMMAGSLSAIAIALTSRREDWQRRVAYFGMLGALGWSFGGSMSYMQVVAYTHSGHSPSVLYGFACLFVIGFLWAAPGGIGTALAAVLDRERLTQLFGPISVVIATWWAQEALLEPWLRARGYSLNWHDTDWLGSLTAILAALAYAGVRRKVDLATSLVLYMGIGWWVGFAVLVLVLGMRMTPPRGDNWSGCVGLVGGLFAYCRRYNLGEVARAGLVTGILGGIGFAAASMLKLVEVTSGYDTNWHSILEQTTGLFNGFALAIAMIPIARWSPALSTSGRPRRFTEVYAVGFILVFISYLNFRKNPAEWIRLKAVPAEMMGISAAHWFDIAYILIALTILVPLLRHIRRPLALIPASALGRGQWLFLAHVWWLVVGNFERALVGFTTQRLVTEGVILLNAAVCTLLCVLFPVEPIAADSEQGSKESGIPRPHFSLRATAIIGCVLASLSILVDWQVVRAIYGDRFAGHAKLHTRFGPQATSSEKPKPKS